MKYITYKEMLSLDIAALLKQLKDFKKEKFNYRLKVSNGDKVNTSTAKKNRKSIARILTIINRIKK